jgi:hypothetical protein
VVDRVFRTKLDLIEEPWSTIADNARLAEAAVENFLILRNETRIDISNGIDWMITFPENDDTNRMYLYSLSYVGTLLSRHQSTNESKYLEKAISIFNQWTEFVSNKENRDVVGWIPSGEHAASIRVHVCIKFIQVLNIHHEELNNLKLNIINELFYDANWLTDDDNYPNSNHGIMMNVALLLASRQFGDVEEISKSWENKALERSEKTMKMAFSIDGVSQENSVFYHFFNIVLYKKLLKILHHYSIRSEFLDYADRTLKLASIFSAAINRHDSTIPPLGDSYEKKYNTGKYVEGSWFYKDGGYVIVKEGGLYLTLKCGYSSGVHKHVDDGSITVRYDDTDIIIDAGLFNYDGADRFRKYFVSSKAHSGTYPTKLSGADSREYCKEIVKSKPYLVTFHRDRDYIYMTCNINLWGNINIYRRILIVLPNIITISDIITAAEPTEFVQQFLLHPDFDVDRKGTGSFELSTKGLDVKLEHHNPDSEAVVIRGSDGENVDGWYSPSYMEKMEAPKIVLKNNTMRNVLNTTMIIGAGIMPESSGRGIVGPQIDIDDYLMTIKGSSDLWRRIDLREELEARSTNIEIVQVDDGARIMFKSTSIVDNNYIQVFDGAFLKPPQRFRSQSTAPFDEGYVLVEFDLGNSSDNKIVAHLFVMQYSEETRISSRKFMLRSTEGSSRLEYCDPLEKGTKYVKLAIKFLNPAEGLIIERIHLGFQPIWSRMR